MDSKFYVSYEAARLLKEKEYNEETEYTIDNNGRMWLGEYRDECDFPCPTKSEAIDWLESKGIYISVYYRELTGKFFCEIHYNKMLYKDKESDLTEDYKTRCEAKDAVIIKALEVL